MSTPEQLQLFLLKIIKRNGNIEPLKEMGYEYSQIVTFIKNEIKNGNAKNENGKLKLTLKGESSLSKLEKSKKKEGPNEWIEPEIQSKIPKLGKNDVYLPNQSEF